MTQWVSIKQVMLVNFRIQMIHFDAALEIRNLMSIIRSYYRDWNYHAGDDYIILLSPQNFKQIKEALKKNSLEILLEYQRI